MAGDREKLMKKHRAWCICEPCPSYNECMRAVEGRLFCIAGRAENCTFDPRSCLCPECPVKKDLGLKKAYYCIRGTEQEQVR